MKNIEEKKFDHWYNRITGIGFLEEDVSLLRVGFCNGYLLAKQEAEDIIKLKIKEMISFYQDDVSLIDSENDWTIKRLKYLLSWITEKGTDEN